MKILNLYAGLGGNRKKWGGDSHITAVEMEPDIAEIYRKQFPNDTIIIGDAHQYLLHHAHEFDFVWSSPPCQTHSRMMKATRHVKRKYTDMSLYQEVIFLQHFFDGKFVVENVKPFYEPLIKPTSILGRHYFWANFNIPFFQSPEQPNNFITADSLEDRKKLMDWLGIHYEGNIYYKNNHSPAQVLRNCVHPDIGKYILDRALGIVEQETREQGTLFE